MAEISHEHYMRRCLQLAAKGLGRVASNPMVGAVLVHRDEIIGEGYHARFGEAHAEINCFRSVSEANQARISEATLYVSLEPCCHFGKTPPCTSAILQHQIKEVIIACQDPFAKVNGQGIELLRQAGVQVTVGVLEQEGLELNKRFLCFHEKKRPYIILKWAESKDGFIGRKEERVVISNALSQQLVHQWRSEEAGIWVGYHTAIIDNPELNVRLVSGQNPLRIVYDRHHSLPEDLHLFDGSQPTKRFHSAPMKHKPDSIIVSENNWLEDILSALHASGVVSVIVEGGRSLLQHFIDKRIWDEARIFHSAKTLEYGVEAPVLKQAFCTSNKKIGNNSLRVYIPAVDLQP